MRLIATLIFFAILRHYCCRYASMMRRRRLPPRERRLPRCHADVLYFRRFFMLRFDITLRFRAA